jgi:hypothetical protein
MNDLLASAQSPKVLRSLGGADGHIYISEDCLRSEKEKDLVLLVVKIHHDPTRRSATNGNIKENSLQNLSRQEPGLRQINHSISPWAFF